MMNCNFNRSTESIEHQPFGRPNRVLFVFFSIGSRYHLLHRFFVDIDIDLEDILGFRKVHTTAKNPLAGRPGRLQEPPEPSRTPSRGMTLDLEASRLNVEFKVEMLKKVRNTNVEMLRFCITVKGMLKC